MSMPFDTLQLARRRSAGFPHQQAADMSDANLGNDCSGSRQTELLLERIPRKRMEADGSDHEFFNGIQEFRTT